MRFPVTQSKRTAQRGLPAMPAGELSPRRLGMWLTATALWVLFAAVLGMTLSQMVHQHDGQYPNQLIGFWLFLSIIPGASAFSLTNWLILVRPGHN